MTIKIGLLWHSFSSDNLGVGALSICNYEIIKKEVSRIGIDAEYVVIGSEGSFNYLPSDKDDTKINFVHFSVKSFIKNPLKILKAISSCNVVFDIGEGDSFSDIYGHARLAKRLLGKYTATIAKVPLVMSPQTIGPFKSRVSNWFAKDIMSKCMLVVARDRMSHEVLEKLQISNFDDAIDVAFCLDYQKNEGQKTCNSDTLRVGINISGLLYSGGYTEKNQFGLTLNYKVLTDDLIEYFSTKDKVEVHLVPHVISKSIPIEDDYRTSISIKEKYPNIILPSKFVSPSEAKSYISNMDFFIGARMHATIAALSSGVPVVPLAYSRKFSGLYETIGYPYVIDMKVSNTEETIDKIKVIFNSLDEANKEVNKALSYVDSTLASYRKNVRQILLEIINGRK